jgi:Zn-dependent protease
VATSIRGLPLTARAEAAVAGASGPGDLLRRLVSAGAEVGDLVRQTGGDLDGLRVSLGTGAPAEPPRPLDQVLDNAAGEANLLGHPAIDRVHLLMGLLYHGAGDAGERLALHGVTLYDLRTHLLRSPAAAAPAGARRPDAARRPAGSRRAWRVSPAFLIPLGATVAGAVPLYLGPPRQLVTPLTILFVAGGWVVSLCLHEFAHALAGYLGGDRGVADTGYLTLNPLRYTHWLFSIALPVVLLLVGGIGLPGGAVYIDSRALRSKGWDALVSAAGPAGTLVFIALIAWPFALAPDSWFGGQSLAFWAALAWLVVLEIGALVLNLLPIPPFDGFGILAAGLSWETRARIAPFGSLGVLVVFLLLWQGPVARIFWGLVLAIGGWAHVPSLLAAVGRAQMLLFGS